MIKKCEPWGRPNALARNGKACKSRGAKAAGWPRMRLGAGEASVAPDRGPLEDRLALARWIASNRRQGFRVRALSKMDFESMVPIVSRRVREVPGHSIFGLIRSSAGKNSPMSCRVRYPGSDAVATGHATVSRDSGVGPTRRRRGSVYVRFRRKPGTAESTADRMQLLAILR